MYIYIDRLYKTDPFFTSTDVFTSRAKARKAKKVELARKWVNNYPEYEIKLCKLVEVR